MVSTITEQRRRNFEQSASEKPGIEHVGKGLVNGFAICLDLKQNGLLL